MGTKLTTNEKLNKIFPTVKVLWDNVTDDDCCSYIDSMTHALCGHYELYLDNTSDNEVGIDFEFVKYWMMLCNSDGLTIEAVRAYYKQTLEHFIEIEESNDNDLIEQFDKNHYYTSKN